MTEFIDFLIKNPVFTVIGAVTLVQISPLKLDPWKWIFKQIKNFLVGDLVDSVKDLSKDFLDEKINNKRWHVLDFSNSCRQGNRHTKEEWDHCLEELSWYEDYCEKHKIPNGVMVECAAYLREKYRELLRTNDFMN